MWPRSCPEAECSLWLPAPTVPPSPLPTPPPPPPHPKAPAQQRVLPLSSEKGPAFSSAAASQLLSQPLAVPPLGSQPFPHELLVHSSVNFSQSFLLILHCCSCPLYPQYLLKLETRLKHHLLCATSYSPADRGLHFTITCVFSSNNSIWKSP